MKRLNWELKNNYRIHSHIKWSTYLPTLCSRSKTSVSVGKTGWQYELWITITTAVNPVLWQSWMAAYPSCTLQMKTLFPGWPIMVHDTHTRRRLLQSVQYDAQLQLTPCKPELIWQNDGVRRCQVTLSDTLCCRRHPAAMLVLTLSTLHFHSHTHILCVYFTAWCTHQALV